MNWESSVDISTLQRKTDSSWEPAVKHRKLSSVPWDDREGGMDAGREVQDGRDRHCTAEATTTLQLHTS